MASVAREARCGLFTAGGVIIRRPSIAFAAAACTAGIAPEAGNPWRYAANA